MLPDGWHTHILGVTHIKVNMCAPCRCVLTTNLLQTGLVVSKHSVLNEESELPKNLEDIMQLFVH